MWNQSPSNIKELHSEQEKELDELRSIFKQLFVKRLCLGETLYQRLRSLLVRGYVRNQEAEYLQSMRRDEMAAELGKTRKQYEEFLEEK